MTSRGSKKGEGEGEVEETKRSVSIIEIKLSKKVLDTEAVGY
jgi:hypothetical protein